MVPQVRVVPEVPQVPLALEVPRSSDNSFVTPHASAKIRIKDVSRGFIAYSTLTRLNDFYR